MFITELLLVWPVDHMDPDITDWVTKPSQLPWAGNKMWPQFECDTLTYRVIRNTIYIVCDKVTENWKEIFEELGNEEGLFWNNFNVSVLCSQHLNWNLLPFLPGLSHFDLEQNSCKKIVKTKSLRLSRL